MKPSKTLQRACRVLKNKVRFKRASFRLSDDAGVMPNDEDTAIIKKATERYIESWVIPIIEAIEKGDIRSLDALTRYGDDKP